MLDNLKEKDDIRKKIAVIDHVYHLQHNTNTVFNKLKRYNKSNGYEWINRGLDFRANLKSFYELIDKCSEGLKPFLYALIKEYYGVSKESFDYAKDGYISTKQKKQEEKGEVEEGKKSTGLIGHNGNFIVEGGTWEGGTW